MGTRRVEVRMLRRHVALELLERPVAARADAGCVALPGLRSGALLGAQLVFRVFAEITLRVGAPVGSVSPLALLLSLGLAVVAELVTVRAVPDDLAVPTLVGAL